MTWVYVVQRFIHYNYGNQPLTPSKLVGVYTDFVNDAVEDEIKEFASSLTKDYSSKVVLQLKNFIDDKPIFIYKSFEIVIHRRQIFTI